MESGRGPVRPFAASIPPLTPGWRTRLTNLNPAAADLPPLLTQIQPRLNVTLTAWLL
jgi:hypothetical protein